MLPEWLSEPVSARAARGRAPSAFLSRTLRQSARLLEESVFAERAARLPGFLQRLDARAKLLSVLSLLVAASFLQHLPSLWLLGGFVAMAAVLSRLGVRVLFHRLWWFLPVTFSLIAFPAVFSVITPGDPVLILYHREAAPHLGAWHLPAEVSITRQGLAAAALVVTRLFVGVLLAVTLVLTTRWQDLLKAIYSGATAPFVLVLAMTHRYLFVLLRTVENMHLGREARSISRQTLREQHAWVGGRIGALFSRSRHLSEEVYQAMLARGYQGEPKALTSARVGRAELVWLSACAALIALALFTDRSLVAGLRW